MEKVEEQEAPEGDVQDEFVMLGVPLDQLETMMTIEAKGMDLIPEDENLRIVGFEPNEEQNTLDFILYREKVTLN
jgi:hypothetical protein